MFGPSTPIIHAFAEWDPDCYAYRAGEAVVYDGCAYEVVRGHTSHAGSSPPTAPALWKKLEAGTGQPPASGSAQRVREQAATAPPRKPRIAIQLPGTSDDADFDIVWRVRAGCLATSWRLLEDGAVIYEAALPLPEGPAATGGSTGLPAGRIVVYRVAGKPYGVYSYQVVLLNSAGSARSDLIAHAVGGASPIVMRAERQDDRLGIGDESCPEGPRGSGQTLQITISQGDTCFTLNAAGVAAPRFSIISNKNPTVMRYRLNGSNLRITGLKAGRAALRIVETSTNQARYVGVRVREAAGAIPGLPPQIAIGAGWDPGFLPNADPLDFWRAFAENDASRRVDIGCMTFNGGPPAGSGGQTRIRERTAAWVREHRKLGMIPFFVYANLAGGAAAADHLACAAALGDPARLESYFRDLRCFLEAAHRESEDEPIGVILEPDLIGLLMRYSNRRAPSPLDRLPACVAAAYSSGVLDAATAPAFPNTVKGLIEAINYTVATYAPNARFGWQFRLWASPGVSVGIPGAGLIRLTDSLGWAPGRVAITNEARIIADYYLNGGIASHGASFIVIDKHGLETLPAEASTRKTAGNPAETAWFWNADHWSNYLMFSQALHERAQLPVIVRQLPVGRINDSQSIQPDNGRRFPALATEDSAAAYFFGDTFKPGSNVRQRYFGTNHADDHKIVAAGEIVAWGGHMTETRASGVIALIFDSDGSGNGAPPPEDSWWITKAQYYLAQPTPLE